MNAVRALCLVATLLMASFGCDDGATTDNTLPPNALTLLPRSYLVDVELVWSDCRIEGWTLEDGQARAIVAQEQSGITWTQRGIDDRGGDRAGGAWIFRGGLCPASVLGQGVCAPAPTFESVPVIDAGVDDGGMGDGGMGDAGSVDSAAYYLRLTARAVTRLSFGDSICRAELRLSNGTVDDCYAECPAVGTSEGDACRASCVGICSSCHALELPVKPCSCDVMHTYIESELTYDEGCRSRAPCTIGMVLSARSESGGCTGAGTEGCGALTE